MATKSNDQTSPGTNVGERCGGEVCKFIQQRQAAGGRVVGTSEAVWWQGRQRRGEINAETVAGGVKLHVRGT